MEVWIEVWAMKHRILISNSYQPIRKVSQELPDGGVKFTPIFGIIITHRSITPLKLLYLPLRCGKFYSLKFTYNTDYRCRRFSWAGL